MTILFGFCILLFVMFNAVAALWFQEYVITKFIENNLLGAAWR